MARASSFSAPSAVAPWRRLRTAAGRLLCEQLCLADVILLNKADLVSEEALGRTLELVRSLNRTARVLALQALMLEADPAANDLEDGDSGIEGRGIKRKARAGKDQDAEAEGAPKKKKKKKKGPKMNEWMGYEWTTQEEADFKVEAVVGKVIADGKTAYANQGKAKKGTFYTA